MGVLIYLPLLIPAIAAAASRPLSGLLEPRQATWLLTGATAVLAACSTAALALLAASSAARFRVLAVIGDYSAAVMRRGDPVAMATGVAAAVLLTVAVAAVAVMTRRRALALAESYRRAARLRSDDGIVIVPGAAFEAYALPGWPGRVVVSGELLAALDARSRAALLAHERAHLSGRHHWFTTVARLAAAANPLLLPLSRAVDYTVERWADERAAAVTGDRQLVAATIGKVALLAAPRRGRSTELAITGQLGRLRGSASIALAGPVPRRVAALLSPPPRRHLVLLAAAAIFIAVAAAAALLAAYDLHALLEIAQAAS